MVNIDPKMTPRLDELEADLLARGEGAVEEGWLGEIEGIDVTLAFLQDKRRAVARLNGVTPVHLRLPPVADARSEREKR
jgi:hypothetical protein